MTKMKKYRPMNINRLIRKIFEDKRYYRLIDENGKPVDPWILDKK